MQRSVGEKLHPKLKKNIYVATGTVVYNIIIHIYISIYMVKLIYIDAAKINVYI
jgi:hypothetical protein